MSLKQIKSRKEKKRRGYRKTERDKRNFKGIYISGTLKGELPGRYAPILDKIVSQYIKSDINYLRNISESTLNIHAGKCQKNSKKS